MQLGLNQYEEVMMESGYDDIDFVSSVTEEELIDIGISKKGLSLYTKCEMWSIDDNCSCSPGVIIYYQYVCCM